jgi:hypothetical protein
MNSQTPETDAFLERHRQHNEDEMESTVEMLKRMECQRNAAVKALRTLDRQMSGNETYEHAWVNYPTKPEASPASLVRKAISENDQ